MQYPFMTWPTLHFWKTCKWRLPPNFENVSFDANVSFPLNQPFTGCLAYADCPLPGLKMINPAATDSGRSTNIKNTRCPFLSCYALTHRSLVFLLHFISSMASLTYLITKYVNFAVQGTLSKQH